VGQLGWRRLPGRVRTTEFSNRPPDPLITPACHARTLPPWATRRQGPILGLEMAWTCPVCQRPGKRTREHVFGRWLADLLGVRAQPVTTFSSREGALWSSRGFEVVVDVCAVCNQGWMSNLESAFSAVFSSPILGHPAVLDGAALSTLAHWATKTALMLEPHLAGTGNVTHRPLGHSALLPLGPPPGSRVWLGAYAPRTRYVFWQGVPMSPADQPLGPDATRIGYATLMTVGHLSMVVLAMNGEQGDEFTAEGLPGAAFRLVWPLPVDPVPWPEGLILNDQCIAAFWPPRHGGLVTRRA
jgi:hypothetical protein